MVNYGSVFGLWREETKDAIILKNAKNAAKMNSKSHASITPFKENCSLFFTCLFDGLKTKG